MQRRIGGRTAALAAVLVAGLGLAACSSGGSSTTTTSTAAGGGSARAGTLVIGGGPTPNLDPAQLAPPYGWPVFDTLIHMDMQGNAIPDLATKWEYADTSNTKLKITLRSGVTFSNGEAFNADAVVASMNRFLKQPGPVAVSAGPISSVTAEGADTVLITYKVPVPLMFATNSLNQTHSFGMILAPASLKDEASIATNPISVGPYKVDAATSTSAAYAYVANDKYFNQDAIKYNKVVIRAIPDAAAQLAALQSGQIQWANVMSSTSVAAAKSAGLKVVTADGDNSAYISLLNRGGTGPLANVKVRQAISYALPRADMVKAVFAGLGNPTSSIGMPGGLGYDKAATDPYPYDVTKAKALLTEAGYPNGFSMTSITMNTSSTFAQAIAAALKEVGITMDVTVNSGSFPEFMAAVATKKYDTMVGVNPSMDVFTLYTYTLPMGQTNNAFEVAHDELDGMITEAAKKSAADQGAAYVGIRKYLDDQAWVVPVALTSSVQAVSAKVQNVPDKIAGIPMLLSGFSPVTEQNWSGS